LGFVTSQEISDENLVSKQGDEFRFLPSR